MDVAILNLVIQGGSFALVVLLVYWGVVKLLPSRDAEFLTELREARKEYREDVAECRKLFNETIQSLMAQDREARSEWLAQIHALAQEIQTVSVELRNLSERNSHAQ